MIHSFLHVIIQTSAELKVDGKHIILTHEPMGEQNAFHMMHIPPFLRLEYFYLKLRESNYSKQAVMSASDYIETAYRKV